MSFKDDLREDFDAVFLDANEFAEVAVYTHDGASREVRVLMDLTKDPEGFTMPGQDAAYLTTSEIPELSHGDTFAIGGTVWTVSSFERRDGTVEIVCGRST